MSTRRKTELHYSAPGAGETRRWIEQIGEAGERAGRRVQRGAGQASGGLRAVNRASREAQGILGDLSARAGPAGRILSAMGPAGAAAAAGIGAFTLGMGASVRAVSRFEQEMLTVEAVLRATGGASGQTAEQINRLAQDIGLASLATTGQVRQAAAQLLTFRSVSGETFERTLRLSQDLAALGFGSITSATQQLGKALEDPRQGLTSLRRVGISFTQAQQDLINSLNETGRSAEAQTLILNVLEQQVGGAGVGQAAGLAGAADSLSENWTRLLENIGQSGPAESAAEAIRALADAIAGVNAELEATPFDRLETLLEAQRIQQSGTLAERFVLSLGAPAGVPPSMIDEAVEQARIAAGIASDLEGFAAAQAMAAEEAARHARELEGLNAAVAVLADRADPAAKQARELAEAQAVLARAVEEGAITAERAAEIEAGLAAQLDNSARATERLTARRRQTIATLRFEIERLGALAAAHRAGAAAVAAVERETEALTVARRVGLVAGDAELDQIRALIDERARLTSEIEAATEAEERRLEALETTRRETEEAFGEIVDFGRDLFTDWFEDLAGDWGGLWGDLTRIAGRALAQLAAQAAATVIAPVFSPQAAGLPGGLFGGGFGSPLGLSSILTGPNAFLSGTLGGFGGLNQFGFNVLGTGLPGLPGSLTGATLSSVLGAFGLGAFGGSLLTDLIGLNPTGGSIGGGLGAGIGFAIGGPLGGLIGGIGGSLLGGLFGGKPSTELVGFGVDPLTGTITPGSREIRSEAGVQNEALARDLASAFANQIVPSLVAQLGGSLPEDIGSFGFSVTTRELFLSGSAVGQTIEFGREEVDALLTEAARRLAQQLEGVSDELLGVIEASQAASVEGLLSDIEFAKFILGEGQPATLTDALEAISAELDAMRDRALDLGLAMDDVTAAVDRTRDALVDELLGGIEAFQQSLAISDLAPVSPLDRFTTAQGLFDDLSARALAGDLAAIQAFPAAAQEFLGIARDVFASGPDFAAVFAEVNRVLDTILAIPSFAGGTESAPAGLALVGEDGPELVRFQGGEQVLDAAETRTAFAAGRESARLLERNTAAIEDMTRLVGRLLTDVARQAARLERLEATR